MAQTRGDPLLKSVEKQVKDITSTLHTLLVITQGSTGQTQNELQSGLRKNIIKLLTELRSLISTTPHLNFKIPVEVIDYVQEGRNPDIYTREFVELVMKINQMHKGKTEAFGDFRDILAREFVGAVPEMRVPVERVVGVSGGKIADTGF
ncbi:hypothetical protein EG328_011174 [Venturia inaequalis]|uniref:Mediator of RNA polymerase II transcription subunit 10 n=1 Tax=Venturia inaequalis TaxID=5025 RepID=A0A8H3VK98_VENIN|nr:hypothetical protein EG328_011174 [Venturia inaequalis]KAE9991646.1 hypothetical protein EG327_011267 [Venturia inaequalis]RDI82045.1 hypothetical protein Vi05172_g7850 [Venturia inaequalis]